MKKIATIIIVLVILAGFVWAEAGNTSADFLNIAIGARPAALGEAYTAVAEGAESAYWNPASLAELKYLEVITMHADWLYDTSFQYFGLTIPDSPLGSLGLSYRLLNYGQIQGYTNSGAASGEVVATDAALMLSWANRFNDFVSYGLNVKMVDEILSDSRAATLGYDAGLLYKPWPKTKFSLTAMNQLGKLQFVSAEANLPTRSTIGVALTEFFFEPLTVSCDYVMSHNYLNLGVEYFFSRFFAARVGVNSNQLQGGLGIVAPEFRVDYAYVPQKNLSATHRVSLSLALGQDETKAAKRYYELGKEFYLRKEYVKALAEFNRALELDPLDTNSRELVDKVVEEMKQKIQRSKVDALTIRRRELSRLLDQAVIAFQQNQYELAKKWLEQALIIAPDNQKALTLKKRLDTILKIKQKR